MTSAAARARRRRGRAIRTGLIASRRSASVWIYRRHCFTGLKQLVGGRSRTRVAERDGNWSDIWSRDGQPFEELPDPFAPEPPPNSSARAAEASPPLATGALHRRRDLSGHARLAGPDRASVARTGAAQGPRASADIRGRSPDCPPWFAQGSTGRRRQAQPDHARGIRVDRGSPFLSPLGNRSARNRPGDACQPARRRRSRGRQHHHPAARQDQLPVRRPNHQAQGAGGDHRLLARGVADQEGDPLALPLQRLFRRRRLWPARGRSPLFQPRSAEFRL